MPRERELGRWCKTSPQILDQGSLVGPKIATARSFPSRIPATGSSTSHEISALAGRMAMTLGDSWTSTRSLERCVLDFPDPGDSAAEFFTGGRTAAAYLTVAHSDGVAASDG